MASPTVKRKRKFRRIDHDGDPEFQVAPMVDVLLVLMLFFMAITSTEVLKKDKNLKLAEANHAKKDDTKKNKPDEIVVNVEWQNETASFSYDGLLYPTAAALESVLATRHTQNPKAYVLIRADKQTEYSNISDVMSACASAGIATVSFAVITNPAKLHEADAAPNGGT